MRWAAFAHERVWHVQQAQRLVETNRQQENELGMLQEQLQAHLALQKMHLDQQAGVPVGRQSMVDSLSAMLRALH